MNNPSVAQNPQTIKWLENMQNEIGRLERLNARLAGQTGYARLARLRREQVLKSNKGM